MLLSSGVVMRRALLVVLAAAWAGSCWAVSFPIPMEPEVVRAATPHPDVARQYKYIPLGYHSHSTDENDFFSQDAEDVPVDEEPPRPKIAPSELILTVMRTALDIVRNINKKKSIAPASIKRISHVPAGANTSDTKMSGRGMYDYYDDHHDTTTTTTEKPAKPRYTDPWAGYYDFLINEGSFKFWSVFQLFTAALLLYACFSAIYYAKFNPIIPDYDREYDDYFLERSMGRKVRSLDPSILPSGLRWIGPQTFQFIMNAIANNYESLSET